jgi:hypothetical protein
MLDGDWSSDVCSSDLQVAIGNQLCQTAGNAGTGTGQFATFVGRTVPHREWITRCQQATAHALAHQANSDKSDFFHADTAMKGKAGIVRLAAGAGKNPAL